MLICNTIPLLPTDNMVGQWTTITGESDSVSLQCNQMMSNINFEFRMQMCTGQL